MIINKNLKNLGTSIMLSEIKLKNKKDQWNQQGNSLSSLSEKVSYLKERVQYLMKLMKLTDYFY